MLNRINPCGFNYNFLQFHYCSPPQAISPYSQQTQQCCNISDTMNRWQASSLQSQVNCINKFFGYNNDNNKTNEENAKTKDENISNYMDKEFLYESELKEIEDKFHFKFDDLGFSDISTKDKIYIASMQIIEKLKDLESKYISNIDIIEFSYSANIIYVACNNKYIWDIKIESNDITNKNKDDVMNMCNKIIRMNIPEYQQFYEKYKNRIVKDNEYEDLSYYEKILEESC